MHLVTSWVNYMNKRLEILVLTHGMITKWVLLQNESVEKLLKILSRLI